MEKICVLCKKEYQPWRKTQKFCSNKCYILSRWGKEYKCRFCGEETTGTRFCNPKCQHKFWNKNIYRLLSKKRYWLRKKEIIEKLGGKCVKCGATDYRILDINHIDRKLKRRPTNKKRTYTWTYRIKEWNRNIKNLELLCANCHRIHTWKQMGYGEY